MAWQDFPCKLVTTALNSRGYPTTRRNGKQELLTRIVLEDKLGHSIPTNQEACHWCDTPNCIESEHLYAATHRENMEYSGKTWGAMHAAKTHCSKGHPFSGSNLYIAPYSSHRQCKICTKQRGEKYRARLKGKKDEVSNR
jgi:hypothetical protein